MKTLIRSLPAVLLLALWSCQKEPVANFTASKTNVKVGEPVTFTNNTKNGHSYEWEFGDGTSSTEMSPVKVFTKAGTFKVRMEAYSKNGKKEDQDDATIIVEETLTGHFIGTLGLEASFSEDVCQNGYVTNNNGNISYNLVIRAGAAQDEIIIDNLAGKGINNVRAKVTKTSIPYFESYEFEAVAGQTLIDANGKVWNYGSGDITGMYEEFFECKSVSVSLHTGSSCSELYYWQEAYSSNCY